MAKAMIDAAAGAAMAWAPARRALAPYATHPDLSAGRLYREPACPMRTPFQRDRDRIVHATSFRRLTYKTQVFIFHEGDHYRTRLTHSLEVAQIARAIARLLWLDEDLAEALALAHDLGHPPFGHAGERALAAAMAAWGGFDHNAQSFKVVTRLERKYASFDGLNLTFETLEGLAKHNGPLPHAVPQAPTLLKAIADSGVESKLHLPAFAPAEAQVAAIADDIAYDSHDLDDGLRAGLLRIEELANVALVGRFLDDVPRKNIDTQRLIYEINRRMITAMIEDAVAESRRRLAGLPQPSLAAVRTADRAMVAQSERIAAQAEGLKAYLYANVYRHPRVMRVMRDAEAIVGDLFARYLRQPEEMSGALGEAAQAASGGARAAIVADFVAGMTDRFAIKEHRRLFDATPELR
ncbi:MAG TPA: deoxyguanosinetriphosphate triphosphohydrolase [Hyphomicrobiaceae bacterium]|jgi:dGTPase|nr:deoxyguanosinetriphosphate triphosphohydrolase [Hyphomicrobiaceae bacterium]